MLKIIRNMVAFLVIATILAFAGLTYFSSGRSFTNKDDVTGNTIGNIYNGGLFSEQDGNIYFRNDIAGGKLYRMDAYATAFSKVSDDTAAFINADDNYLYYVRAKDTEEIEDDLPMFRNTGVYRVNHLGKDLKAISTEPSSYLMLYGNYLYFQRYDVSQGTVLYRSHINGKQGRVLDKDTAIPAVVDNNTLYYTDTSKDKNIHGLDLSSFTSHALYDGSIKYPIFTGDYIYYINLEDKSNIYRRKLDGSNDEPVIKDKVSTYNITKDGRYLIYQVTDGKKNRICRYNLQTLENETLKKGNFNQIHVTEHYIFFKDMDNQKTYIMLTDGSSEITTFSPPDLDALPEQE